MSVRLDLFPEVAVLRLGRAMGVRQVQVLAAGIRRVFGVGGVKVVFVDARAAAFDDAAVQAIRELTPALCKNDQGVRMVIVSRNKQVGEYRVLEEAIASLAISNKGILRDWFAAEDEADALQARQAELETQLGASGDAGRQRARQARGERVRVERMKDALTAALANWGKRLGLWRRQAPAEEAVTRLRAALAKLKQERKAS